MEQNLSIFTQITNHLVYLTTYDDFGCLRSRGISNFQELADELNNIGIIPARGYWSPHSLECFFSRCRKKYSKCVLKDCCDLTVMGASNWEYLSGSTKRRVTKFGYPGSEMIERCNPKTASRYKCIENEKWKEFEVHDLLQEERKLKKDAKNRKILANVESFSQKAA